jgi:hypothetical protein
MLSLVCLPLLRYAEAKQDFDHAKDAKDLARWKGSELMDAVKRNTFDLAKERRQIRNSGVAPKRRRK